MHTNAWDTWARCCSGNGPHPLLSSRPALWSLDAQQERKQLGASSPSPLTPGELLEG